jgi:hypothetical protein
MFSLQRDNCVDVGNKLPMERAAMNTFNIEKNVMKACCFSCIVLTILLLAHGAQHRNAAEEKDFKAKYEQPVKDAIAAAKKSGEWSKILCKCDYTVPRSKRKR